MATLRLMDQQQERAGIFGRVPCPSNCLPGTSLQTLVSYVSMFEVVQEKHVQERQQQRSLENLAAALDRRKCPNATANR